MNNSETYGERVRGIRNQKASLILRRYKVSWRFEEMEHNSPTIHSPFRPHHHQRQHLCGYENGRRVAKETSELSESW